MTSEGQRLDPSDWDRFDDDIKRLLQASLTRMRSYADAPWQPKPDLAAVRITGKPRPLAEVFDDLTRTIMPTATGNTHPAFWGWVHGGGIPAALGAEIVAATMNANCGGRDHGATDVECAVIDWLCDLADLPTGAFGILTSGTSQATILALSAARYRAFGPSVRTKGIAGFPEIVVYASQGAHSCMARALEVMGHGSDCLRSIPTDDRSAMQPQALIEAIAEDRAAGRHPLAIVGTAGSVGVGAYDDLNRLAEIAQGQNLWLHIDAAFGFWTRAAAAETRALSDGIGRADSIALDAHKWPGVQYDCGACLIADAALHRETFATRPAYLESADAGLAGGDIWFTDYGLELSRGFRALKLWTVAQVFGTRGLGAVIDDNCRQARLMGKLVEASPHLTLRHPVISNVCCFSVAKGDVADIAADLQIGGKAVFSTITLDGQPCLRAAIVNHRTTEAHVKAAIKAVESTQS